VRMKVLVLLCVLLVASCFALGKDEQDFQDYIKKYQKHYDSAAYTSRLENFKVNLRNMEKARQSHPLATFEINRFFDMSEEEFRGQYKMPAFDANEVCQWPFHRLVTDVETVGPASWDWRSANPPVITPVKDQQQCGSCWTFSSTGNIEGVAALKTKKLVSLSEQEIVDCSLSCLKSNPSLCNGGCGGGLPWLAYGDIINWGSITTEAAYPYTATDGTCNKPSVFGAKISNWTAVVSKVSVIESYLVQQGPLSICLNAGPLMSYSSGIITGAASTCPGDESDHAVLLVGYATDSSSGVHYWIVKNSWNTSWGESGYFRIQAYDNDSSGIGSLCGITACVTSTIA